MTRFTYIFHPSRATVCHYDVDEETARGEAYGGRRRFAFDCSLPPAADYEENKTQEEGEVCLDERLVAAQSALRSVDELREEDARGYKNYMSLSPELFQELLERVGPRLEKGDTFMRKALRPRHRLAIVSEQGQRRDMLRICCGCVTRRHTVIYGFLRSLAVDYGRNKIFEHVENRATEKNKTAEA